MIPVDNRQRRVAVRAADVRAVVAAAYAAERAGDPCVAVSVIDDAAIRAVNARWLGHDWATDAIAFSYADDPGPDGVRGEVLVSAQTARREAQARDGDPRAELLLYVAHGTLHLLGWDDDTPARRAAMNARARSILRGVLASAPAARGATRAGVTRAARSARSARSVRSSQPGKPARPARSGRGRRDGGGRSRRR